MPIALLTGTSGFVGGYLADALRRTHEVLTLLRQPPVLGHAYTQWDLREPLPAYLPEKVDLLIHAAATDGRGCDDPANECFSVNTAATARLLDYAARVGVRKFVYISTGSVYPLSEEPVNESTAIYPVGHYAASKAAAECLLGGYTQHFDTLCLRLFHPYGPGQKLPRLIPGLFDKIRRGVAVPLQGEEGSPAINPVNIRDLVAWTLELIRQKSTGTYNIAGAETVSIRQLATQIAQQMGIEVIFDVGQVSSANRLGNFAKVSAATGMSPQVKLAAGIEEVLASV